MIVSGLVSATAAATTLVSGAIFKRAFDQYHQGSQPKQAVQAQPVLPEQTAAAVQPKAVDISHGEAKPQPARSVHVDKVTSIGQKGGVTAGYVESVNQGPS